MENNDVKVVDKEKTLQDDYKQVRTNKFSCPSCGAGMQYSPTRKLLYCQYCTKEIAIKNIPSKRIDYFDGTENGFVDWGEKKAFKCDSCAAVNILEKNETATLCKFCGASNVVKVDDIPGIQPTSIVPFEKSREEAVEIYKNWMKKSLLSPDKIRKSAKVDDIKPLHVPSWVFDYHYYTKYEGRFGYTYYVKVGKNMEQRTRWERRSGVYQTSRANKTIFASGSIEDKRLFQVEPFYVNEAVEYQNEYLSGSYAEKYSKGLDQAFQEEIKRADDDARVQIKIINKADHVDYINLDTTTTDVKYRYTYVPVYYCNSRYKGKDYQSFINGKTGVIKGKRPLSFLKIVLIAAALLILLIIIIVVAVNVNK